MINSPDDDPDVDLSSFDETDAELAYRWSDPLPDVLNPDPPTDD